MRTFTLGSGSNRKCVVIETDGPRVVVVEGKPDGSTKRKEKDLKNETLARTASERLARELISRGFVEKASSGSAQVKPIAASPRPATASQPASRVAEPKKVKLIDVLAEDDGSTGAVAPVLTRLAPPPPAAPAAEQAAKKKKKRRGKKRKQTGNGDGLDKRVIAAVVAFGAVFVAGMGLVVYDTFLKPASIVATWRGSRLEYEVGRAMTYTKYQLILDEQKHASLTLDEQFTSTGTYALTGDRLKLTFKNEDGGTDERQYRISLGHSTLDLYDPTTGKKMVELVRLHQKPAIGGGAPPPSAPKDVAGAADKVDKAADARLAAVEFSPKDSAFKVRHPQGWEPETGSRPDNTYSWARFTHGSAKIQVFADIQGSLMSGSNVARDNEAEGSVSAPVHTAHELYKKTASEEFSEYQESEPTLFKGSPLGEGRIAAFTASAGGLFGGKLRGYRVTLLTTNRRITVLCQCPEGDFEKLKPTFLAVCRSVSP